MGNKYFSSEQHQNDIAVEITPTQMGQIVVLADNNQSTFFSIYGLTGAKGWINAQLVELYCFSEINISIPEVRPPELRREDGEYANIQKTNDYLWTTSRLELELYKRTRNRKWALIGIVPIKHNGGFRYRRNRLMDLFTDNVQSEFGRGGAIGIKLINVGYGNLQSPDKLVIYGSWIQEPVIVQEQLPAVVNTAYFTGTSGSNGGTTPPQNNEVTNEFTVSGIDWIVVVLERSTRISLSIEVITAGFSGGRVGARDAAGNWLTNLANNPVNWSSSEGGRIITTFTDWKGKLEACQNGWGDPGDSITLKITEKYAP